jgi:hypothetical protein
MNDDCLHQSHRNLQVLTARGREQISQIVVAKTVYLPRAIGMEGREASMLAAKATKETAAEK